jgi:proline iminopeptidase
MARIFAVILCFFLVAAAPAGAGPRQGYIETPDGVRLFYKVAGSGPETLIAVHGGPGNSLSSIAPDFVPLEKQFTIIYYDQRGNGYSDLIDDPAKLSLDRHVADLDAVRAHFGLRKMKLLGNSWGGLLVAAYASAHPDRIERMVMHDPAPPTRAMIVQTSDELGDRARRRLDPEKRRRLGQLFDGEHRENSPDPRGDCREWASLLLPLMTAGSPVSPIKGDVCDGTDQALRLQQKVNGQIWSTRGDFDLRPGMAAVTAPVLIIHGEADYIPLEGSRAWAASMPNARLLLIAGAGHTPQGEQPQIFFPAVEAFLKGGWPTEAKPVVRAP